MERIRTSESGGYELALDERGLDGKVSVAAEAECNHAEQDERATERFAAVMPIKYTRSASSCTVRTLSEKCVTYSFAMLASLWERRMCGGSTAS